jgi:DNA replication protein DnaC
MGYVQLDHQSAEFLFQLVCTRYETGSIVLTSNKFFSGWDELMSDTVIATAILDRLLHQAHVINIRGEPTGSDYGRRQALVHLRRV